MTGSTQTRGRTAGAALFALGLAAACGRGHPDAPRPTSISPDHGSQVVPVPVRIRGEGFGAQVSADLSGGGGVVDARFQALLGDTSLDDVALQQDGAIAATVPVGMAPGTYDLTVVGPDGKAGTLAQAYTVAAPGGIATRAAAFRVEAVGTQVARRPFTVTVTAVDAGGAVVADHAGSASLSDLGGTVVPARVGPFSGGRWTGTIELRAPHAGNVLTVADAGGAEGRSPVFEVWPAPAALVGVDAATTAAVAGRCTGPVTLSLLDAFGQPTSARSDTALGATSVGGAGFALYGDGACGAPLPAPVVTAGQGTASVWFTETVAGTLRLTATGPSLAPGERAWTVAAGPPATLTFVTAPQSVGAGACSGGATVEVRDAFGNPSPDGVAALDLAAAPAGGFQLYDDGACATPASVVTVPAGATRATFRFRGTAAGPVTVAASAAGLAAASQDQTVSPGPPTALVYVTPARSARARACSAAVTLESRDAYGNPSPGAALPVDLAAGPGNSLHLHADASCQGAPASAVTIQAGDSQTTFHFKGKVKGSFPVTASATGLAAATQTEAVEAGDPAALAFASAPQAIAAHGCSGAVTLSLADADGNAATAAADLAVDVAGSPAAGFAVFADAGCTAPLAVVTIPAGASAAAFHFSAAQVGPVDVMAGAAGLASATQTETVAAAAATRLAFATAARTVAAGSCSGPVTVEARDAYGNPSPASAALPTPVALAGAALAYFAGPSCAGAAVGAVTLPAGATSVIFSFRGNVAGTVAVTASAGGLGPDTQTETIVPGPATQLAFTTSAQTVDAGTCSGAVTVEARDAQGNAAAVSASAATAVTLAGAGLTYHAGSGCPGAAVSAISIPAGATSATFSFRGTLVGTFPLTATATGLSAAGQIETIVPGTATQLAFTSAAQTIAAGSCSGPATVASRDAQGNASAVSASSATAVALAGAGLTYHAGGACSGAPVTGISLLAGATSATFSFRGTAAGTVTVTATAGGLAAATQNETIVAAAPTRLVFTTASQTVQAGSCSGAATVQAQDANGNPSAISASAATAVTLAGAGLAYYAGAGCGGAPTTSLTLAAGATAVTLSFRGTTAGTATVSATAGALTPATQGETITPAQATRLAFASPAQTVQAGTCSAAVTLEARDSYGNPAAVSPAAPTLVALAGAGLTAHPAAGCGGGAVTSLTLAAGATTVVFWFDATVAGTATATASAGALAPATQSETITAAAPAQLAFRTAAQTVPAGTCSGPTVVELRDTYGNPSPSAAARTVGLAATGLTFFAGAGCTGTAVTWVGLAAGTTTATLSFSGTVAGPATITASITSLTAAVQTESVAPAAAAALAYTTPAQTVAAGSCSGPVTVEARDAYGNPGTPSASASTPVPLVGAGLVFYAGAGCGGGGTTQVSIAAGASAVTFSFRGTVAGTVAVTASAAGLSYSAQNETLTAGALDHLTWAAIPSPQPGSTPFAVALSARDLRGNLVTSFTGTVTLSASPGAVACATSCASSTVTAAFTAGQWSGTVSVPAGATGVTLTASGSGATGTSGAFDVQAGWASRSPPLATFTASPRIIVSGSSVSFDASASSDRQTAAAALEVSWDFTASGYSGNVAAAVPPASPWSAWTTAKTASHAYINNGTAAVVVRPRLAVRDGETGPGGPDVGYAGGLVVVLPNGNDLCVVDTTSLADDGATGCFGPGPDGVLSLTEAVRLANAWPGTLNITFGAPMTIAGAATLTLTKAARIVGISGVVLDGVTLVAAADDVLLAGLEFRNLSTPITVRNQSASDARLEDLVVHDGAGILVQGHGLLNRVRLYRCTGTCVRQTGTASFLGLWNSELHGAGVGVGVTVDSCSPVQPQPTSASPYQAWTSGGWSTSGGSVVASTVLADFDTGISIGSYSACANPYLTNLTLDGNGTGVRRDASAGAGGGLLLDSAFTNQTVAAIDSSACAFFIQNRNSAWGNAALGCLSPTLTQDPLYVWRAGRDYRIQYSSPLKDTANASNTVEVDDAGPGLALGSAPDRGGRETY